MGSHYDDEELRKTVKFEEVDVDVDDDVDQSDSLLMALDHWEEMPSNGPSPFQPPHNQATRIARVPAEVDQAAATRETEGALICTGVVVSNGYIRIAAEVAAHLEEGEQLTVVLRRNKPKST